jgi:hypothetical protein
MKSLGYIKFLVGFVLYAKFRFYQVFSGVHVKFRFYQVFSGVRVKLRLYQVFSGARVVCKV